MKGKFIKGIAFIVEGITEKIFYLSLLNHFCDKNPGTCLNRMLEEDEHYFLLDRPDGQIIIKFFSNNAITQIPKAHLWFSNSCNLQIPWVVFLCYDKDSYKADVTPFNEGDWDYLIKNLRQAGANEIVNLGVCADVEDLMLQDLKGIFKYLKVPQCSIPNGSKGKIRLRKLFRMHGYVYHSGERSQSLIDSLNKDIIIQAGLVPLHLIEEYCFN